MERGKTSPLLPLEIILHSIILAPPTPEALPEEAATASKARGNRSFVVLVGGSHYASSTHKADVTLHEDAEISNFRHHQSEIQSEKPRTYPREITVVLVVETRAPVRRRLPKVE